ncbi:bifunctional DNA primase/polymerase [Georgenia sp. AZ-5]|uniref:bifunctional DNA primase/polymerase n=1 Tax=Georgenia sp. AZ-5 TaxID=3367526 RepID=UPI003754A7DE
MTDSAHSPGMLSAALDLAAAGWEVFPCWPGGDRAKAPMTPHGHLDATTDTHRICGWWTRHPTAMIGAAVPRSLLVLDIDPRNGGSRPNLEAVTGPLPPTQMVTSGRGDGGVHLYFLRPTALVTSTRLPAGVDLKVNGYCIVPPSRHPATQRPYAWSYLPPQPLPAQALAVLRAQPHAPTHTPASRSASWGALARFVAAPEPGERNQRLFWAACRAAELGADERTFDDLRDAAVVVGLPDSEARRAVDSARRRIGMRA